ncbi:unnamed protein product [Linum trigynum]|uniref:Aminotransferase-like plant mobile domain-containing protein n=1 Tax=Linum trigynum TaxID=586398 RepID=A0AAV2FXR7_9ROSI
MARTKNPSRRGSKHKEPVTYSSRQVQVGSGQTSDSIDEAVPQKDMGKSKAPGKKCSPASIIAIVENGITNSRIELIKKLGLDFVFHLKMKRFDSELLIWLIDHFNGDSMSIQMADGRHLVLTVDDVQRVYGLPRGQKQVPNVNINKCKTLPGQMLHIDSKEKHWNKLWSLAKKLPDVTEDAIWIRMFVMLVFGYVLEPTSSAIGPISVLEFLQDNSFSIFCEYDWCTYVWKKLKKCRMGSKIASYANGDLHLLTCWFLDRTSEPLDITTDLPSCEHYDHTEVYQRRVGMLEKHMALDRVPYIHIGTEPRKRNPSDSVVRLMEQRKKKAKVSEAGTSYTAPTFIPASSTSDPSIGDMGIVELLATRKCLEDMLGYIKLKIGHCDRRLAELKAAPLDDVVVNETNEEDGGYQEEGLIDTDASDSDANDGDSGQMGDDANSGQMNDEEAEDEQSQEEGTQDGSSEGEGSQDGSSEDEEEGEDHAVEPRTVGDGQGPANKDATVMKDDTADARMNKDTGAEITPVDSGGPAKGAATVNKDDTADARMNKDTGAEITPGEGGGSAFTTPNPAKGAAPEANPVDLHGKEIVLYNTGPVIGVLGTSDPSGQIISSTLASIQADLEMNSDDDFQTRPPMLQTYNIHGIVTVPPNPPSASEHLPDDVLSWLRVEYAWVDGDGWDPEEVLRTDKERLVILQRKDAQLARMRVITRQFVDCYVQILNQKICQSGNLTRWIFPTRFAYLEGRVLQFEDSAAESTQSDYLGETYHLIEECAFVNNLSFADCKFWFFPYECDSNYVLYCVNLHDNKFEFFNPRGGKFTEHHKLIGRLVVKYATVYIRAKLKLDYSFDSFPWRNVPVWVQAEDKTGGLVCLNVCELWNGRLVSEWKNEWQGASYFSSRIVKLVKSILEDDSNIFVMLEW